MKKLGLRSIRIFIAVLLLAISFSTVNVSAKSKKQYIDKVKITFTKKNQGTLKYQYRSTIATIGHEIEIIDQTPGKNKGKSLETMSTYGLKHKKNYVSHGTLGHIGNRKYIPKKVKVKITIYSKQKNREVTCTYTTTVSRKK